MTARSDPAGIAVYSGDVRLWQDANMIEAPTIQFDRNHRAVVAEGSRSPPGENHSAGVGKDQPARKRRQIRPERDAGPAPSTPITITGLKLTYADSERKIHYEGGVVAKSCRVHGLRRHRSMPTSSPKPNYFESDPCSARTTRSDGRPRQRRDPAAEPPGGRPEAGLHRGRGQVRPDAADRLAFLMPNRARLPGFR